MPQFNASSALLFKRFVESGVTSPEELANVMGNASVETGSFSTMDEQLKGYHSVEKVVGAVRSTGVSFPVKPKGSLGDYDESRWRKRKQTHRPR